MKKFKTPNIDLDVIKFEMEKKIRRHLIGLDKYNNSDKQKQLEICQIGKALVTHFPEYEITEVREKPDFIISNRKESIGIEHQLILDPLIKKYQGFYESIFLKVQKELENDNTLSKYHLVCFLEKDLSGKNSDKKKLINEIKQLIINFVIKDDLPDNKLIRRILKMPSRKLSIHPNFGAHFVKNLDESILLNFISKKEKKLKDYRKEVFGKHWLFLVTGSAEEYSYDIIKNSINIDIESDFDKIFLFSDFNNELFLIK